MLKVISILFLLPFSAINAADSESLYNTAVKCANNIDNKKIPAALFQFYSSTKSKAIKTELVNAIELSMLLHKNNGTLKFYELIKEDKDLLKKYSHELPKDNDCRQCRNNKQVFMCLKCRGTKKCINRHCVGGKIPSQHITSRHYAGTLCDICDGENICDACGGNGTISLPCVHLEAKVFLVKGLSFPAGIINCYSCQGHGKLTPICVTCTGRKKCSSVNCNKGKVRSGLGHTQCPLCLGGDKCKTCKGNGYVEKGCITCSGKKIIWRAMINGRLYDSKKKTHQQKTFSPNVFSNKKRDPKDHALFSKILNRGLLSTCKTCQGAGNNSKKCNKCKASGRCLEERCANGYKTFDGVRSSYSKRCDKCFGTAVCSSCIGTKTLKTPCKPCYSTGVNIDLEWLRKTTHEQIVKLSQSVKDEYSIKAPMISAKTYSKRATPKKKIKQKEPVFKITNNAYDGIIVGKVGSKWRQEEWAISKWLAHNKKSHYGHPFVGVQMVRRKGHKIIYVKLVASLKFLRLKEAQQASIIGSLKNAPWYSKNFTYLRKDEATINQQSILKSSINYRIDINVINTIGRVIGKVENGNVTVKEHRL